MRAFVLLLVLFAPALARAQLALPMTEVREGTVRVDGALGDWREVRMAEVGRGNDASFRYALGYDAQGLYVAAEVRDDRLIRTARPGTDEDAIVLTLALPSGSGLVGWELWLWAGETGRTAASAGLAALGARPRAADGARIVEGPRAQGSGYVLEAFVPWRALRGSDRWQEGRGAIRLHDVDEAAHPAVQDEPASATVDAAHLERLPSLGPSGGQAALLDAFLTSRSMAGRAPRFDLRGDVAADARPERVVIVERSVVVMGPGYRDGAAYAYTDLPGDGAEAVRSAELVDLTGDGKSELVCVVRQRNELGAREVWQVLDFGSESPHVVFGIETRKETREGFVESRVSIARGRRGEPATITTELGRAEGLSAANLRESPAAEVEAILVPWGPIRARSYRFTGGAFQRIDERANPGYQPPDAGPPPGARPTVAQPTAPPPPGTDDVIAAFRAERRISARARFDLTANLAEGPEPERLLLLGKAVLVVGARFRGGNGYFYYELGVASEADVLDVRCEDVTGDGAAEVVVRARQALGAGPGGAPVTREVLLVHQLDGAGFPRLLAVEVARQMGASRLENDVQYVGEGRARRLQIAPGRATQWDATTYPFDTQPSGGVDAIQLPWAGRTARYEFRSGRLVSAPR